MKYDEQQWERALQQYVDGTALPVIADEAGITLSQARYRLMRVANCDHRCTEGRERWQSLVMGPREAQANRKSHPARMYTDSVDDLPDDTGVPVVPHTKYANGWHSDRRENTRGAPYDVILSPHGNEYRMVSAVKRADLLVKGGDFFSQPIRLALIRGNGKCDTKRACVLQDVPQSAMLVM